MNDKYVIPDDSVSNVVKDGRTEGYQIRIRIPYYSGVPLSQVDHIKIKMDGKEVDQNDMYIITSSGEKFSMSEIQTVNTYYWEYGEKLRIYVNKEDGLRKGNHSLNVDTLIDVVYAPKAFCCNVTKEFII